MSVTTKPASPVDTLRTQLLRMQPEFRSALPSHIKPERFQRVVMTVVQQTPELLGADRGSLLAACTKCAADGLIPDGREAALVIFNVNVAPKGQAARWEKRVQYMPMLIGILKRARNSGEIAGIIVNVVHENDEFIQRPDDFDKPVEHRPPKLGTNRGQPVGAYALAKLKDGTIMHDVMDRDSIEKVRAVSRSKDSGPWVTFWDQMARKTVFRRLSKYLPMDSETDDLMRRDDEAGAPTSEVLQHGPVVETTQDLAQIEGPPSRLDALEGTIDGGEVNGDEDQPKTPGSADAIIAEFAGLETLNDIVANEKNVAVSSQIGRLSVADKARVAKAIDEMKNAKQEAA